MYYITTFTSTHTHICRYNITTHTLYIYTNMYVLHNYTYYYTYMCMYYITTCTSSHIFTYNITTCTSSDICRYDITTHTSTHIYVGITLQHVHCKSTHTCTYYISTRNLHIYVRIT